MADDFVGQLMSTFRDKLSKEADVSLKEYILSYKKQLSDVEKTNANVMKEAIADYHKKRESLANELEIKVNKKMKTVCNDLDLKLAKIEDELFNDPLKLYNKIVAASDQLKKERESFQKEKANWKKEDLQIAQWLGIPCDDIKLNDDGLDDDDEKDDEKWADKVSDSDFITIKIDDQVFRTYRGTLTQVQESFMARLFSAHSDKMHMDKEGSYCLNYNPKTFGSVLDILRKRGTMPMDFNMTPELYSACHEFGILKTFFPDFDVNSLKGICGVPNAGQYHVVFKSWRSNAMSGNYLRWNVKALCSLEAKQDEHFSLNSNDNSEIIFNKVGYYRITFRCCINYSTATQVSMYINGTATDTCYHTCSTSNHYKSYNFNEVRHFEATHKLRLYAAIAPFTNEANGAYLCIEKIPEILESSLGIWKGSTMSANYRVWNNALKATDTFTLSGYNMTCQKGGLYRVSMRSHSYYQAGVKQIFMYDYRNAGGHQTFNNQSANHQYYEAHMFDDIFTFKKADYFNLYNGGYGVHNAYQSNALQLIRIPFTNLVGSWRSSTVATTYKRVWNFEYWTNDQLFKLNADKSQIEVQEDGNYRICANVTNSVSGNGHVQLYVNTTVHCISRMGTYSGAWTHTATIQEIVQLKKGDYIYIHCSHPYNGQNYNMLFMEKVL